MGRGLRGHWTDWDKPAPPVRIHANTYLVGTCGISVDPDHRRATAMS